MFYFELEYDTMKSMKILAFDTSNNSCSVAISEGQTILAYIEDLTPSMQASMLLPMIEEALTNAKLSYNDIEYLAVTSGPGSFTGIRIGLAAATGILLGSKIKGGCLSNFDILYYRAKQQVKHYDKVVVLLDAYRNQLYLQIFGQNIKSEPLLLEYDEAIDLIQQQKGTIIVTGSGAGFVYNKLISLHDLIILPRFTRIKAMHICRYADELLNQRVGLSPIEPLYIRPPDAKITMRS